MTIELTIQEKTDIINQHLKNLAYTEYNLNISLVEANAASQPNQDTVSSINQQLSNINAQKSALQSELDSLS
jgi:hypothetical protein